MSFPRYPKYKDSGVAWLGEVPEHWNLKSLKSILAERKEKNDPIQTDQILSLTMDRGVIPYAERGGGGNKAKEDLSAYKLAYPDDIVLNSMNVIAGSVGLSRYFGAVSPVYYMLRPRLETDNVRYFGQIFQAETFQKSLRGLGNGILIKESESSGKLNTIRMRIPMGKLNPVVLPYPDPAEQTAIAAFLDRETAKIDGLVVEQRRLMELLKEKRQAVISHAVTKGLNPDAPMKPSGIEWLGDVPEHWAVASVRRAIVRIEQGWSPSCLNYPAQHEKWGVVKSGCVNRGIFAPEKNKELPEDLEPIPEYEIHAGDVLMSRASGSPELVGSTAYISATRPKLMLSDKIFRIHPEPTMDREFFVATFNSNVMRSQIERAISGAEGLANNLPQSAMKSFYLAVPPIEEQQDVVVFLSAEVAKFDTLTTEAQRAIDLLQERRTALISAAVTGQIDVRKEVA